MVRRILIVEDDFGKVERVMKASKMEGFEVITISALEIAKEFLLKNEVNAIVTDGKFFVLGFSMTTFKTTYPYYWGQMWMTFDSKKFQEFISSLKD